MNVVKIEGASIKHFFDIHTIFWFATVLPERTSSAMLSIFVKFEVPVFVFSPIVKKLDQKSSFTTRALSDPVTAHEVSLHFPSSQSQNYTERRNTYEDYPGRLLKFF